METKIDDFVWMAHDGCVDLVRVTHVGQEFVHGIPVEEATRAVICVHESNAYSDPDSAIRDSVGWCKRKREKFKLILSMSSESRAKIGTSF
jgi:hypothetical protein